MRLKICCYPGCKGVTTERFCDQHKTEANGPGATGASRKFLNTRAWRRMSARKLKETPWCEECARQGRETPAEDVDHIKPRRKYPELALEYSNLQSMCKKCHGRKIE